VLVKKKTTEQSNSKLTELLMQYRERNSPNISGSQTSAPTPIANKPIVRSKTNLSRNGNGNSIGLFSILDSHLGSSERSVRNLDIEAVNTEARSKSFVQSLFNKNRPESVIYMHRSNIIEEDSESDHTNVDARKNSL
jgi:hypothetical protein